MLRKTSEDEMCFSIEMTKEANYLEKRFGATCLQSGFEEKEKIFSLQEILTPDEFHALLGSSHARSSTKLFKPTRLYCRASKPGRCGSRALPAVSAGSDRTGSDAAGFGWLWRMPADPALV